MRRGSGSPYDYDGAYGDTSGRHIRTRRNINQRISVGNLDSEPGSILQKYKDRSSSNDRSDYNIDESESEEGPVISKTSAVFSPPINQKGGGVNRANYNQHDNPFNNVRTSNTQFQEMSPIKPSKKNNQNDGVRPSDIDNFQTPFTIQASPIDPSSTQDKRRFQDFRRASDLAFDSEDGYDDLRVLDSDDLARGRNKDVSPHNRNARPRSSCIKKDWNKERDSDISTPKQVRFAADSKAKLQPTNLDSRLKQESNKFTHDIRTSYPDDEIEYVREISRAELQNKYGSAQNDNLQSYNMGKRLRSNERLNSEEIAYERSQLSNENDYYNPKPVKKTAIEKMVDHSHASRYGRTTPPRSFQMKNIVSNTNYSRKELPDRGINVNTTIPEMSSKYEESRDETSYYRNTNTSIPREQPRSRSPFNVSQNQNTSYVKQNFVTKQSPTRSHNFSNPNNEYYEIDEGTTVLQQKPSIYNTSRVNETRDRDVENYNRRSISPVGYRETYNEPIRISNHAPRQQVYYRDENYSSPLHSPIRRSANESPVRENAQRQRSPRERPLGSPKREMKKHDSTTEDNIAFRFVTNKLLNKTVEDMIFKLIPEFFQEAQNPPVQQVIKKAKKIESRPKFESKPKVEHRELMSVMKEMDMQDEDSDNDIDERTNIAPVTASMNKKETINQFVKKRVVDSMGIKFETNKRVNGVKGIAFQDKHNYPMIDVKSGVTRKKHEICDVWCSD